jgi:hypothetical protein
MAVIRYLFDPFDYKKGPFDRIVSEADFNKLFESHKIASKEWLSIECIQSTVKAKYGLGRHIPIHFRAELNINQEKLIAHQYNTNLSVGIMQQNPPVIKYEYDKIGREFA